MRRNQLPVIALVVALLALLGPGATFPSVPKNGAAESSGFPAASAVERFVEYHPPEK